MTRTTIRIGAAALGILLAVAACHQDQLFRPYPNGPLDPMFTRYVSMGNSITAVVLAHRVNNPAPLQAYAGGHELATATPDLLPRDGARADPPSPPLADA